MKRRIIKIGAWFFGTLLGLFLLITGGLYFFKDDICGYVLTEVNKNLKVKISISRVDLAFWSSFPNLSVDMNDVFVQDSYKNSTKKDTLLFSERIRLKFNPLDIWNEKYNLKGIDVAAGTIQLKINENGVNNFDIFKEQKNKEASNFNLNLKKVLLEDVRFSYRNKASSQHYLTHLQELELEGAFSEQKFTLHSKSTFFINQAKSGSVTLISNKPAKFDVNILVNKKTEVFEIPKAILYVANLPFEFKGKVTPKNLNFNIHSKNLKLEDVANNLRHSSIQDITKFSGTGTVNFDVTIAGPISSGQAPEVNCSFGIHNGSLVEPSKGLKLKSIFLNGKYSNQGGKSKEFLGLSNISFSTIGGPFKGDLMLTRFDNPIYKGNAKGRLDLEVLQSLFSFQDIEKIGGQVDVKSDFNIQSDHRVDNTIEYTLKKCEGDLLLKNVNLQMKEDKRFFQKLNGAIYLRDNEIGIDKISLNVGSSDLLLNGIFKNVIGFLKKDELLETDVDISSNFIDIQDLSLETKQEQIKDGKDWILPTTIMGNITLNANDIKYEKHHFKRFNSEMILGNRAIQFSNLTVQNANADVRGALTIEEKSPEVFTISTQLASDNIEFKALFKEWNNFEQTVISEDNIYGKVHVLLDFSAPFDLKTGVLKKAIKSQIQLKIIGGRLKNVSAFKSITESLKTSAAKYILRKNNINELEKKLLDLKFETLENTFVIQNGQLEIPKMIIHSNALDMELYGKHDFDNTIDYHFDFRFREIKTQKNQEEFGQIIDDNTGVRVFIHMYGNIDSPTIEWDQDAKKEQARENREAAKQDAKSILKTEFGMFKNDSTVKTYQPIKQQKEEIKMEFGPAKKEEPVQDPKKVKKDSKFNNALKKMKEESEKEKKEEFEEF
jgi:hypothetical protein